MKTMQARITKSSLIAPGKTPLSRSAVVFQKFELVHPDRGRCMREGQWGTI